MLAPVTHVGSGEHEVRHLATLIADQVQFEAVLPEQINSHTTNYPNGV